MNEDEARRTVWKRTIWGFVAGAALGAVAVGIYLDAPSILRPPPPEAPPVAAPAPVARPVLPILPAPLPPLNRAELIAAVAEVRDAVAGGGPVPPNSAMIGRSFTVRLPFGCEGPSSKDDSGWAGWHFNPKTRVLKLWAHPENWSDEPWIAAIADGRPFESVEGFWMRRPWTSAETCPARPDATPDADTPTGEAVETPADANAEAAQTLGLAQFFSAGTPRTLRRGDRPYNYTVRRRDDTQEEGHDYLLSLSGRIARFADGRPINCTGDDPLLPPRCLIAVEFGRVAFEDPRDGATLSEWRN